MDELLHKTLDWKCTEQCFRDQNSVKPKSTVTDKLYKLKKNLKKLQKHEILVLNYILANYSS